MYNNYYNIIVITIFRSYAKLPHTYCYSTVILLAVGGGWLRTRTVLLNTCYFLAVLLRTECAVQLLEGEEREIFLLFPPCRYVWYVCK
jgi:hypothetical protein